MSSRGVHLYLPKPYSENSYKNYLFHKKSTKQFNKVELVFMHFILTYIIYKIIKIKLKQIKDKNFIQS